MNTKMFSAKKLLTTSSHRTLKSDKEKQNRYLDVKMFYCAPKVEGKRMGCTCIWNV